MYTQHYRLLIATALLLTMVSVNAISAATASQEIIEARQETQSRATYAVSPSLRSDLKLQCTMARRCSPAPSRKLPMEELAEPSKDLMP